MSWDILVFNSEEPVDFEEGNNCPAFESRKFVVDSIKQTFPSSVWKDSAWGVLDNNDCSLEFNVGQDEDAGSNFMIHVHDGGNPEKEILKMCKQHGWVALDISGQCYLDEENPDNSSFDDWQKYRDQVIATKKPWWKFW